MVLSVAVVPLPAHASLSTDNCKSTINLVGGQGARVPAKHGTVWALPLGPMPISARNPLKVVWRVTGSGRLEVRLESPQGSRVPLAAGPTLHTSSNFIHPGAEYGTIFEFDRPGCWTIRLGRAKTRATLKLSVA
jgi:hypothetical protein